MKNYPTFKDYKDAWNSLSTKMKILIIFIFIMLLLSACAFANNPRFKKVIENYPQDNIIEEATEDLIAQKTGFKVDLSPLTPEN